MRNKKTTKRIVCLLAVFIVVVLAWYLFGMSGDRSNSKPRTGTVTGRISERKSDVRPTLYAYPASTPVEEMVPDPAMPDATTDSKGNFKIENVPAGEVVLVIDYNSDGFSDDRKPGINVRAGRTSKLGYVDGVMVNLKEEFYPGGKRPKKSLKMLLYLPPGVLGAIFLSTFLLLLLVLKDFFIFGFVWKKFREKPGNKR